MRSGALRIGAVVAVALATASGIAACGEDDSPPPERAAAPARPPEGWRTVANRRAGFTISLPRRWKARTRRDVTIVRSPDRLVAATIAADRSEAGRDTDPAEYANGLVERLPGFEGSVNPTLHRVVGAHYPSARLDASGRLRTSRTGQAITLAVYHRRARVTYSIAVFRNGSVATERHERTVRRLLASLRAQPPA